MATIKELEEIRQKKFEACKNQLFEIAADLRQQEKDIMKELGITEEDKTKRTIEYKVKGDNFFATIRSGGKPIDFNFLYNLFNDKK